MQVGLKDQHQKKKIDAVVATSQYPVLRWGQHISLVASLQRSAPATKTCSGVVGLCSSGTFLRLGMRIDIHFVIPGRLPTWNVSYTDVITN